MEKVTKEAFEAMTEESKLELVRSLEAKAVKFQESSNTWWKEYHRATERWEAQCKVSEELENKLNDYKCQLCNLLTADDNNMKERVNKAIEFVFFGNKENEVTEDNNNEQD